MAYILNTGHRPLIFCANPRTGSTAIADAMVRMGASQDGGHHGQPFFIPDHSLVFQVARNHFDVINSFWFKSRPTGNFESFIDLVCDGGYPYLEPPKLYNRGGVTHTIMYHELPDSFEWVFGMVGLEAPELDKVHSRTRHSAGTMFSPLLAKKVYDVFSEEMDDFGFDNRPK